MSKLALYKNNIFRVFPDRTEVLLHIDFEMENQETVFFGEGYLENQYITLVNTLNTGYYSKEQPLYIDYTNLLGSGIRGIFTPVDTPDSTRVPVKKSLYLKNKEVLQFYYYTVSTFYNYLNTNIDPFGTVLVLNIFLTLISPPVFDINQNQQFLETFNIDYLLDFKAKWDLYKKNNDYMPAPISIILSNMGFDSILSQVIDYPSVIFPISFEKENIS